MLIIIIVIIKHNAPVPVLKTGKQRLGPHDNGVKSIVTVGSSFASLCDLM